MCGSNIRKTPGVGIFPETLSVSLKRKRLTAAGMRVNGRRLLMADPHAIHWERPFTASRLVTQATAARRCRFSKSSPKTSTSQSLWAHQLPLRGSVRCQWKASWAASDSLRFHSKGGHLRPQNAEVADQRANHRQPATPPAHPHYDPISPYLRAN